MENFYGIKSGLKGKRDSFEELSCQIFRREFYSAERNFQRYRGDGGDGGVEAVYINKDLSEVGLQSKYWENNSFGTSELTQLSDSLTTALTNHPNLKQYYISIPFNLTGKVSEGHRGKSQTEKFEEWKTKNENKYSIKIILWNSTILSDFLHKHDNSGGLYTYWFDINCLSYESYLRYTDEIIAQAGKRYTPELNIEVPLYKVLNYFSEKEVLNKEKPFNDSDINFVGYWYTDFQRYILKNKIDIFDLEAANISIDDIYKWFVVCLYEFGYPGQDKRAYHFDNYLRRTYGSGRGKPIYIERLSKKYYWILLHRLIGLLSNTCKLKPIKYDDEESLYPLLYSIPLRDIDLSDQRFSIKNKYPKIYSEDIEINTAKEPKEWITDEEDFFEEEVLMENIRDESGGEWIPLNFIQKIKVKDLDSEYPYGESCILLSSSIIDLKDFEKLTDEKMKELVYGNVYDNITRDYRLFLGEYTESRAYNEYEERKYIKEIEYRDDEIKLYPTSFELLRGHEWEYDCSFDSENLLEPAKLLIENLNLSWDCDSGWIDKKGQVQIFCQSFEEHICLFIRRKSLIEFLIKTKKRLLFRIYKEKMYVPDSGFNSSLHNKRILLCFDGKKYQYLINFEDENDYRE